MTIARSMITDSGTEAGWVPSTEKSRELSQGIVMLLLFAVVSSVAVATVTPWPVGAFQDDAIYTVLAKSLAEGHGFRFINLPGAPNATHFPPGYPALLAALWKIWPDFPNNIILFKFVNAAMLGVAACGAYVFGRRHFRTSTLLSLIVAITGTLSIVVLLVTGVVMSEPMFLAMLFPTLLIAERAADKDSTTRAAVVAGLICGFLGLVRTIGTVAVPALCLTLILRRKRREAFLAAAAALVFIVPWQVWVGLHAHEVAPSLNGKYGSYSGWALQGYLDGGLHFALRVVAKNVADMGGMLGNYLLPVVAEWPRLLVSSLCTVLALLGTKRYYRNAPVSLLFMGFYILVVILWPFEPARFLLGIWPLLPLLVGCGAAAVWQLSASGPWKYVVRPTVATLVTILIVGAGYYNYHGFTRKWWTSVQRDAGQRAKPTVEWAARYTSPSDVLSTEDDLIVYLYTGRQAVPTASYEAIQYIRNTSADEELKGAKRLFAEYDPDWYIVGSSTGVRVAEELSQQPDSILRYVGRTNYVAIYQRVNK